MTVTLNHTIVPATDTRESRPVRVAERMDDLR
jgi:hypothetical protein